MLDDLLKEIYTLDVKSIETAQKRLDCLTKPLGSLGKLEDIIKQLSGIQCTPLPSIGSKATIIMCSDNGVVDEGVSSCPKDVTASVTYNFTRGITGINVFSKLTNARIVIVDIGVDADLPYDIILNRKIRKGTWNMAKGPAMTRDEAIKGINTGIEIVKDLKEQGVNLLGTGEMGIGNTSTSSAVASVLTSTPIEKMVGTGSGLTRSAFEHKIEIIKECLEINSPLADDPIDVLSKVGGFDIAGLTGCFIGAAIYRVPIMIDGFISAASALTAVKIHPGVRNFLFPSHGSAEPGTKTIMEALQMEPMLNLNMRLGEGTGSAIGFQVMDAAIAAYTQMGTFDDAEIVQYKPQE
jgi:nicotinate-nucleotide--dimethylbenzimidazole phosphoribosyltransferase